MINLRLHLLDELCIFLLKPFSLSIEIYENRLVDPLFIQILSFFISYIQLILNLSNNDVDDLYNKKKLHHNHLKKNILSSILLKAIYYHYHLAISLCKFAELEALAEKKLEQYQNNKLKYAVSVLDECYHMNSNDSELRKKELAEELKLFDDHRADNQVNVVNLLYFHSSIHFQASLDLLIKLQSINHTSSSSSFLYYYIYKLNNFQQKIIKFNLEEIEMTYASAIVHWSQWQHEAVHYQRDETHQPSKEDERSYLYIYELYIKASLLYEKCYNSLKIEKISSSSSRRNSLPVFINHRLTSSSVTVNKATELDQNLSQQEDGQQQQQQQQQKFNKSTSNNLNTPKTSIQQQPSSSTSYSYDDILDYKEENTTTTTITLNLIITLLH